jgi:hypothetical protein
MDLMPSPQANMYIRTSFASKKSPYRLDLIRSWEMKDKGTWISLINGVKHFHHARHILP